MPVPPGMMPSATSGWLNTAWPRAAKRMSHDSASSLPPPPTRPSITAMVAFGIVRKRLAHLVEGVELGRLAAAGSVGNDWISETSKWAMKKPGVALRSTTTRTVVVVGQLVGDLAHLQVQPEVEQVDRRVVDGDGGDAAVDATRSFSYPS